jgi:membrane-associated phospholipid phosphatase
MSNASAIALCPVRASLARVISDVFSPPVLALPGLFLGVAASNVSGTYRFAILYFLIAVVAPVMYVVWLLKTGRITDFHLADRRQRRGPFIASLGCGMVGFGLIVYLGAPAAFLAPVFGLLAQILLLFLITLAWQVSVHTATTAGLVTFACLAFGPVAACWVALVPLVAWARIYLRRHTLAQTLAGAFLGSSCFLALFALRDIVW